MYNNLVAWYVNEVAGAKRSFDYTLSNIADTYNKHLGINKKCFTKSLQHEDKILLNIHQLVCILDLCLAFCSLLHFFF
jgi:hypothetical protein